MKTQNTFQENYEHILMSKNEKSFVAEGGILKTRKMNQQEEMWARNFEAYDRALLRSDIVTAKEIFQVIRGRAPTPQEVTKMNEQVQSAQRASFSKAKAQNAKNARKNRGLRKRSDAYDSSDWLKNPESYLDQETNDIVEKGVTSDPSDGIIDAIDQSKLKSHRSLEKLIEDAKLSKEAKELLEAKAQGFTYVATVYTFHGRQYMNLNYVLKSPNGQLWVQDQHDRLATMELYLKRETSDSFATHCEIFHPASEVQIWVFKAGAKSNIEGKAVQYEGV